MKKIFLLILIITSNLVFSQKETNNLIVLYSDDSGGHGIENYTWIIPTKSINIITNESLQFPLYINTFSKNNLDDCIENKEIEMFVNRDITNYNFEEKYKNNLNELLNLIKEKSILVQDISIRKKYPKKEKNCLKIFIIPVSGNFQFCKIKEDSGEKIRYQGEIAFPISNFDFNIEILKDDNIQQFIYSFDFSQIKFRNDFK